MLAKFNVLELSFTRAEVWEILMTNSHVIDYFVITLADLTAIGVSWLMGRKWIRKTAQNIYWQKSGHLYWLSSDLMWTWMQVNTGNVQRMNHGLGKAIHHANRLGLGDPALSRLKA